MTKSGLHPSPSFRYWQTRFAGDPAVIGRTVVINKNPATIIGVSGSGFHGTAQAGESFDVSVPLAHYEKFLSYGTDLTKGWFWWIRIMGRLAPGFTAAQARASLEPIFQQSAREGWEEGRSIDKGTQKIPDLPLLMADPGNQGENDNRRSYRQSMNILMGLVSLVLLAACANVANLLLARGAGRRREIAVRLALGASRARVVRQLFAESLLLALFGAAGGLLVAWWGRGLLLALRPFGSASVALELPLDGRVLAFTAMIAMGTSVLFGLVPAWRSTRLDLTAEFQGGTRSLGSGRRSRLSQSLMVLQIGLSLVLLVSTALFVRTLQNLQAVDAGFDRSHLVLFRIEGSSAGYKGAAHSVLKTRILENAERIPGVRAVTYSEVALLNRGRWSSTMNVPGFTPGPGVSLASHVNAIAPNFFTALGIPLLSGRAFTERDDVGTAKVAIVNQAFAQKYFAGQNPVGQRFGFGRGEADREIVGWVRDAKYTSLRDPAPPTVFLPALQQADGNANFMARVTRDTAGFSRELNKIVHEIDPTLPVLSLRTLEEQLDRNHSQERLFVWLSGFFGLLALGLACVGLYGLMSYNVTRRTGEIGLRMALGAMPGHILRMILNESLALVCGGIVLGLAGAYAASQLIAKMLFGLTATDPFTYAIVASILVIIALLTALLPARRAAAVAPMTALRSE